MNSYELRILIQADITVEAETEDMAAQIAAEAIYIMREPQDVVAHLAQAYGWPENVRVAIESTDGVEVESIEQLDWHTHG